jgi:hypothetical protein
MQEGEQRMEQSPRGRGRGCNGSQTYPFQHRIKLLHDFVIPEPQNLETLRTQPGIALMVMVGLHGVLSAVHLDDERGLVADEIDDVAPHGLLAFELQAHEAVRAQVIPKLLFGLGLVRSEAFCLI